MQLCNLHLVVCVNQSHHILKLARQWKFPICNACARWALFQISIRPQQEIGEKLGMGGQSIVGPLSRDYGICNDTRFFTPNFQGCLCNVTASYIHYTSREDDFAHHLAAYT